MMYIIWLAIGVPPMPLANVVISIESICFIFPSDVAPPPRPSLSTFLLQKKNSPASYVCTQRVSYTLYHI